LQVTDVQNARLRERIAKLENQIALAQLSTTVASQTSTINDLIALLKLALAAVDKTALNDQIKVALEQEKLTSTDVTQGINDGSITPFAVAGAAVAASRAAVTNPTATQAPTAAVVNLAKVTQAAKALLVAAQGELAACSTPSCTSAAQAKVDAAQSAVDVAEAAENNASNAATTTAPTLVLAAAAAAAANMVF